MSSLATHLISLNFSTQLDTIKNLIDTAQAKTTFWGSRTVEVNGFTGSLYLDDIANKIIEASNQRFNADDLTPAERIAGLEIVRKLENLYQDTDPQIQNSNYFTQFLNWIREFSFTPYTPRFYIEQLTEKNFRAYSEAKFLQQFGGAFDAMRHPACAGFFELRVLAKEDEIRSLIPV